MLIRPSLLIASALALSACGFAPATGSTSQVAPPVQTAGLFFDAKAYQPVTFAKLSPVHRAGAPGAFKDGAKLAVTGTMAVVAAPSGLPDWYGVLKNGEDEMQLPGKVFFVSALGERWAKKIGRGQQVTVFVTYRYTPDAYTLNFGVDRIRRADGEIVKY